MSDQQATIKARAQALKYQEGYRSESAVSAKLFSEFVNETLAPAAVDAIMKIIAEEARKAFFEAWR